MKRDRVIGAIAYVIAWCEELKAAIQAKRFQAACEQAKHSLKAPRIVITKVVDENGKVLATLLPEVQAD